MSIPNPGSIEAVSKGCICPVLDNEHGKGIDLGDGNLPIFWTTGNCPLHGEDRENECD